MLTAVVSAISIPLLWIVVPKLPGNDPEGKIDWMGGILFAPAVAAMLFGVTMAKTWHWDSPKTWIFVGGGAAVLAFWAWYEARLEKPLINVRLLANRKLMVGNAATMFSAFGMMNLPLVILMILQQKPLLTGVGLGLTATMAGFWKLPSNVSALAASPMGGWLSGKYGSRWSVVTGGVIGALAWGGLIFWHNNLFEVVFFAVCCAFGSNMLLAALPNMVLEGTPRDRSSETTGLSAAFRGLAAAIGAQSIAVVLASSTVLDPKNGAHVPTDQAFRWVFMMIAGTALATAVVALAAGRRRLEAGEEV